jgi:hypothetical protein
MFVYVIVDYNQYSILNVWTLHLVQVVPCTEGMKAFVPIM